MRVLRESGYTIKDACQALGISRSGYYASLRGKMVQVKVKELREEGILEKIKSLKADHPFWGYRRMTAWLRHREGFRVNEIY